MPSGMHGPGTMHDRLVRELRRQDRDRFATLMAAPAEAAEGLAALFAFNLDVARIRELVREPLMGRMRLQWWRDALVAVFEQGAGESVGGAPLGHPVAEALALAVRRHGLSREPLDAVLDGRETDMDEAPISDMGALDRYVLATSASLLVSALEVLDARDLAAETAARHVGIAWGVTGLLRAVPFHAAQGRIYLPGDMLQAHGVTPRQVMAGRPEEGLRVLIQSLHDHARKHLSEARAVTAEVPRKAVPALVSATIAEGYLKRLRRLGFDVFDARMALPGARPLRVLLNTRLGRY